MQLAAATWPQGELLFLVPRERHTVKSAVTSHAAAVTTDTADTAAAVTAAINDSKVDSSANESSVWGQGPCASYVRALHEALTVSVAAQLRLQPAPCVELAWGMSADAMAQQAVVCEQCER